MLYNGAVLCYNYYNSLILEVILFMKTVIRTIVLLAALLLCFSAISCNTNDDKNSDKTLYELAVEGGYKGTEAEWGALLNNADKTVYELAVDGGFKGTEAEWNALLNNAGKTLYELATEAGYEGSAAEWEALINNAGKTLYELAVEAGYKGSEADFEALINGDKKTLYELAVEGGYKGTEVEWEKLINSGNKTLFELAVEAGYKGTEAEWNALLNNAGKTLYELAVEAGYKGNETDFEALIRGEKKTLYELAVEGGYKGTEEDFEKLLSGSVEQPNDKDEEMLADLLTTKHKLKVDENGEFTVLVLSDTHIGMSGQTGLSAEEKQLIKELVDKEKPDLVIFDGDVTHDLNTVAQLRTAVSSLVEYIESKQIPWAHVYGNHDRDTDGLSREVQQEVYERA